MSTTKRNPWSYYYISITMAVAAVAVAFLIGGPSAAITVGFLVVLETSLSLDNAAVNARILKHWDKKWRDIFLFWGILVAVFGMRVLFPLLIVAVIGKIGPLEVIDMALNDQEQYAAILTAAHPQVAGFGGAFLLMVGLNFFFEEKHVYWMEWAEKRLTRFGQIEGISAAITIGVLFLVASFTHSTEEGHAFFYAGIVGLATYVITHGLGTLMGGASEEDDEDGEGVQAVTAAAGTGAGKIIQQGILGFLYLEVLDSSFSFDGVIGAFALTTYLPYIVLGLGAGAFFVRSFTIHMVEAGVMDEYRYLEHGAFYAIIALATIILVSVTGIHIPEWVTGMVGAVILGGALFHSMHVNGKEKKAAVAP